MNLFHRLALLIGALAWPGAAARLLATQGFDSSCLVEDSSAASESQEGAEQAAARIPTELVEVFSSATRSKANATPSTSVADQGFELVLALRWESSRPAPLTVCRVAQPHLRTNGSADAGGKRA